MEAGRLDALEQGRRATAEGACFDEEELLRLLRLARIGCGRIFEAQRKATAA